MGTAEKAALKRVGRGLFAGIFAGGTFLLSKNPISFLLIPFINGLGKYLRAKWDLPDIII